MVIPQELKELKQFMVSRLVMRDGGPTKEPLNPHTLRLSSVTDSKNYETYDFCKQVFANNKDKLVGIAFVFTKHDPYFFIDIDGCREEGVNQGYAQGMVDKFAPTSYVEVSHSGRGLHIIGKAGIEFNRVIKHPYELEVYTNSRFVLLTEDVVSTPGTLLLTPVVFQIFCDQEFKKPVHSKEDGSEIWTDTHADGYSPILDDDKLIDVASRSHTGNKSAPFGYLYNYREGLDEELANYYPSDTDTVNRSLMDYSLAMKLIFWTAGNCERTLKLMLSSNLPREKWEKRDGYVAGTVQQAFNVQSRYFGKIKNNNSETKVCVDEKHPFAGCVYIARRGQIFTSRHLFMKETGFKSAYSHADGKGPFPLYTKEDGTVKFTNNAWEAFFHSNECAGTNVEEYCFRSELTPLQIINSGTMRIVNTFFPLDLDRDAGDASIFIDHLKMLYPKGDDCLQVTSWLAAQLQYAGTKFNWSPVTVGCEGTGKTLVGDIMTRIIGKEYTHPLKADSLASNFNAWLDRKIFITVNEIYISDQRHLMDSLKPLVSDEVSEIEHKGVDQASCDNRANFWMTSNHVEAVKKTDTERRFAVYITDQLTKDDLVRDGLLNIDKTNSQYFVKIHKWLNNENGHAKIANYLLDFDIPDKYNPATECRRAPETSSEREVIRHTRGIVEQEIIEAIEAGEPGFCGGWIVATRLTEFLEAKKLARRLPLRKYASVLGSLGYIKHPGLKNGRVSKIMPEYGNKRPTLYVLKDSKQSRVMDTNEILIQLAAAQGSGAGY